MENYYIILTILNAIQLYQCWRTINIVQTFKDIFYEELDDTLVYIYGNVVYVVVSVPDISVHWKYQ